MLYGGKELRSNPNQYIELRPHRLLIYGGGESGSNLLSPMEFEGNRLLLYGAPDLGPLPPLGPGAVLPLARLRVRGSPPLLRLCVVTTVETMLVSTAPEVPRIPLQPGLDIRLLSSRLTCRRGARILPLLQPRVDLEPTPAQPARPTPGIRGHCPPPLRPPQVRKVLPRPRGTVLEGPAQRSVPSGGKRGEGTAFLQVEEVEAEGSFCDLTLALVEVNPFDEFLLGESGNEGNGDFHDFFSTSSVRKLAGPSSARILPPVFRGSGNAQKRPWEARGGAVWRK